MLCYFRSMLKRFAAAVLIFMTGASPALCVPGAPPPVAQTMAAQHLPASAMSFAIIDPDTGRLIAGQNLDTPRSPASTIKVVTTFASLDLLGPAYVWHTRAAIRGEIHNGVLDGALVLLRPADYAFGTFVALWRELGGEFAGALRVGATPADAHAFINFDSLTLGEIVRLTNKFSNNLMALHLLLTMGEDRFGLPATLDKGAAAIAEWSQERGLTLQDMNIDNGSGLSRATHISVLQMAKVLSAAY